MGYTVSDFIAALEDEGLLSAVSLHALPYNSAVFGISFDNRTVKKGELFVCKGAAFRTEYLSSAMEAGALFYVSEKAWSESYPYVLVTDIRLAMAVIARVFYQKDAACLKKVGITGTKGKTTTTAFINAILNSYYVSQCNKKTALISSLTVYDGEAEQRAKLSTPEAFDLWRYLANAGKRGLGYAVCEVSSQALKYHRTKGIAFDVVAFLNIGEDHISDIEHKDFDDYFSSKLKIFETAKVACLNSASDKFFEIKAAAVQAGCKVVTFGYRPEDTLYCKPVRCRRNGSSFQVSWEGGKEESYEILLSGQYNVENALAALAIAHVLKIPYAHMAAGLSVATVEGRGVQLSTGDGKVTAIVDYAHNKMSMEALFRYVASALMPKKVVTLFGCPGVKATNRRRDMGLAAGEFSDHVIITEDDPGAEPLDAICEEIAAYVEETGTPFDIVTDRGEAIRKAFSYVGEGGVVLLCGKGAENTQKRAEGSVSYETDEYFVVQCIREYERINAVVPQ